VWENYSGFWKVCPIKGTEEEREPLMTLMQIDNTDEEKGKGKGRHVVREWGRYKQNIFPQLHLSFSLEAALRDSAIHVFTLSHFPFGASGGSFLSVPALQLMRLNVDEDFFLFNDQPESRRAWKGDQGETGNGARD
jgi:hypothetical protein